MNSGISILSDCAVAATVKIRILPAKKPDSSCKKGGRGLAWFSDYVTDLAKFFN
jgi:hypothetical protein